MPLIVFVYGPQFIAESLDVIQDVDWVISLGNSFSNQYELYQSDDEHSALLHRYVQCYETHFYQWIKFYPHFIIFFRLRRFFPLEELRESESRHLYFLYFTVTPFLLQVFCYHQHEGFEFNLGMHF